MSIDFNQVASQVQNLKNVSFETNAEAIKKFLNEQSEKEKGRAIKQFDSAIKAAEGSGIGTPSQGATDILWRIVITAFSFVLVGSFLALSVGVYQPASGQVRPELILTMFTTVVGFLAGLFANSPVSDQKKT